jgi:hypothetical protein
MAARGSRRVRHHPCAVEFLVQRRVLRRMMMLLRARLRADQHSGKETKQDSENGYFHIDLANCHFGTNGACAIALLITCYLYSGFTVQDFGNRVRTSIMASPDRNGFPCKSKNRRSRRALSPIFG